MLDHLIRDDDIERTVGKRQCLVEIGEYRVDASIARGGAAGIVALDARHGRRTDGIADGAGGLAIAASKIENALRESVSDNRALDILDVDLLGAQIKP